MITTVIIEEVEGVPPPTGNGFPVHAHSICGAGIGPWRVDSGLKFKVPNGFSLRLESAGRFIVTGWSLVEGRLIVLVDAVEPGIQEVFNSDKEQVATAWFERNERVAVRFVERPREGGRVIRGDAKVVDCAESGDAEPGE